MRTSALSPTDESMLIFQQDLAAWEGGDIKDPASLKGIIAELVACLGPDVARQVVVAFS